MLLLGYYAAQTPAAVAGSYDLIQSEILTSSQASVTFDVTGLGSTYQHLQIRAAYRSTRATTTSYFGLRINGDTGTNYAWHYLRGNGSSVTSSNESGVDRLLFDLSVNGTTATSNSFSGAVIDFLDPFETKNLTVRSLNGVTGSNNAIYLSSGLWNNTSAVTSIEIYDEFGASIAQYSRFSIYGLKVA